MDTITLSKADRFLPLIAHNPENSGGSIALQNILDLKDSGIIDALRFLRGKISEMRAQSQLFDSSLAEHPPVQFFFRFIDAASEIAHARRIMDSGQFLTVTRQDNSNISFDQEIFFLNPIKECLQHIQERYGRFELTEGAPNEIRGSSERIIAMTRWLLLKNHALSYLMTFEVIRIPGTHDFKVKVPKWEGLRPIAEPERLERLSEVENFLTACCHPGRLGVFPAAHIQVTHEQRT